MFERTKQSTIIFIYGIYTVEQYKLTHKEKDEQNLERNDGTSIPQNHAVLSRGDLLRRTIRGWYCVGSPWCRAWIPCRWRDFTPPVALLRTSHRSYVSETPPTNNHTIQPSHNLIV